MIRSAQGAQQVLGVRAAGRRVFGDGRVRWSRGRGRADYAVEFQKKDFAAKVFRESILQCEQIGLELPEFCEIALTAMQGISDELGL